MTETDIAAPRSPEDAWLEAGYDALTEGGVAAVKIMPLAKRLGVTRTGFYWHFKDRDALLEAMVGRWERRNTGHLVARCDAYAESVCEAIFNLFDCWIDDALFDARLDLAIRNWARTDAALQARLDQADSRRLAAMTRLFLRFGYAAEDAHIRAGTMHYTQIGYISMRISESRAERLARMPGYVEVFSGRRPTEAETSRFMARHAPTGAA